MLRVGKHAGCSFGQVARTDKDYCAWILRACLCGRLTKPLASFAKYLEKEYGGMLEVGRYKGEWYKKVLEEDPDYCGWAASLDDPSPSIAVFSGWSRDQLQAARDEPPPLKKPRTEEGSLDCKICFSAPVGAVLLPCGHMTCRSCSVNFDMSKCPFCRERVYQAVHAFP